MKAQSLNRVGIMLATYVTVTANAELIVYEGFQYEPAVTSSFPGGNPNAVPEHLRQEPDGDPGDVDATGLAGTWAEATFPADLGDDWFLVDGSLSFGDLATTGNRIGFRDNLDNDNATRALTPGAKTSVGNASELWFSILMKPTDTRSASAGGFALTDSNLNPGKVVNTTTGVDGFGIGSASSHKFRPYAWDGVGRIDGDAQLNTSINVTYLLVGYISFDTGTDGKDQYSLYDYALNDGSVVGGTLNQIGSTIEADVDQASLGLINMNRQVKFDADEIRIATTLEEALGLEAGPQPAAGTVIMLK